MPKPRKITMDRNNDFRKGHIQRQRRNENRIRASSMNETGVDKYGWNSLLRAVSRNNIDAIYEMLKDPLTNVDVSHDHGWTPLLIAVHRSNMTVTELLLEHNANVDIQNCMGVSCLHEAARLNNHKMVEKLLDWRANPLVLDRFGRPPRSQHNPLINKMLRKAKLTWRLNNIWGVQKISFFPELQKEILKFLH